MPYDRVPDPTPHRHREVAQRLLRGVCEICKRTDNIQVHQVRKLNDLDPSGQADRPAWMKLMADKRRKTLIVCDACHETIHARTPTA
ncbi:RNA-directed DNA polymerase [Micromonospora sp. ATA51]|nr:RNA-directed DNA polymerase [Micromonospora sp. ATA51]